MKIRIQNLGLSKDYKDATEIGKWLKYTFGLIFLDPAEVGDAFVEDLIPFQPEDSRVTQYADYLTDMYISEESTFPPELWAACSSSMCRTTNACESFHAHFKNNFYVAHPNIFVFTEQLLKIQSEIYIKINSVLKNNLRVTNSSTRKRELYLNNKVSDYNKKLLSRIHFIKIISHYFGDN